MEWLDIVDEAGQPTGETVLRTVAHRDGIPHRTAHVWVVRETDDGTEILLQKRSKEKDSFPGLYDTSSAGHIPAGTEPLASALRELNEELGIRVRPEELCFAGLFRIRYEKVFHEALFRDNEITWVYVYREPVELDNLTLQRDEVEEVRWFALDRVWEEIQHDRGRFCVPTDGLRVLKRFLEEEKRAGGRA